MKELVHIYVIWKFPVKDWVYSNTTNLEGNLDKTSTQVICRTSNKSYKCIYRYNLLSEQSNYSLEGKNIPWERTSSTTECKYISVRNVMKHKIWVNCLFMYYEHDTGIDWEEEYIRNGQKGLKSLNSTTRGGK